MLHLYFIFIFIIYNINISESGENVVVKSSMFCYQCQEASKGIGCTIVGVCGKDDKVARLLDFLVFTTKEISKIIMENNLDARNIQNVNHNVLKSLFMSITNANFHKEAIVNQINENLFLVRVLKGDYSYYDGYLNEDEILSESENIGVLSEKNEDIRSLKEMIVYGVKGMAAYAMHASNLGQDNYEVYDFIYRALYKTLSNDIGVDELFELAMETGKYGVKVMECLDNANTSRYGNPEITKIKIGVGNNPGILVSGHDLRDLEILLDQTKGKGIDVYTHGEMLPAHTYPYFKKYDNLYGNYGNAWHMQLEEFKHFNGPILFTTNCIVPPKDDEIKNRIFTTGAAGYEGCTHIHEDENGDKDFSDIIELSKRFDPPREIEDGEIIGGFAHNQVSLLIEDIIENIENGSISEFVVMAGCDGRMKSREYYTDLAKSLPDSSLILTAGCAKYRYNKLDLGDINGIPKVIDAGQCNDSYSLVKIAMILKERFNLDDINDLPIRYEIAWYEQKAVIVLLSLLYLGVKNIKLGPTLPAFLSKNVLSVLVDKFNISGMN